jgi:hypothetical protein
MTGLGRGRIGEHHNHLVFCGIIHHWPLYCLLGRSIHSFNLLSLTTPLPVQMEGLRERSNTFSSCNSAPAVRQRGPQLAMKSCCEMRSLKSRLRLRAQSRPADLSTSTNVRAFLIPLPIRSTPSDSCGYDESVERDKVPISVDVSLDGAWSSSSTSSNAEVQDPVGSYASNEAAGHTITPEIEQRTKDIPQQTLTPFWLDSEASRQERRRRFLTEASPSTRRRPSKLADRFLPARESPASFSDRFRTVKESHRLSTSERIFRCEDASPDPFGSGGHRFTLDRTIQRAMRLERTARRTGK